MSKSCKVLASSSRSQERFHQDSHSLNRLHLLSQTKSIMKSCTSTKLCYILELQRSNVTSTAYSLHITIALTTTEHIPPASYLVKARTEAVLRTKKSKVSLNEPTTNGE